VIAERNGDPRWCVADCSIEIDPRSRYFEPYDPDRPPMPPDDPTSHKYMHYVAGMKGWKHWHDFGDRIELENPAWRDVLGEYVEIGEDGSVKLDVDSALKLAYVHAPSHQNQLETLYLSALDVTQQRFNLDTRFFGGFDEVTQQVGSLRTDGAGRSNTLTVGRGSEAMGLPHGSAASSGANVLRLNRRFATAGELVAGIANSFMWEFTRGDINFASSILSASIVQPLLRGAGRDIALHELTNKERALLADLRAYSQYRQGFYTQVAIGDLGVAEPQRGRGGTAIARFTGQFNLGGGYLGLLQQLQLKRNAEDNLALQEQTLERLEAYQERGLIDLVQVLEFRQDYEAARSDLLIIDNGYKLSLDRYKTGTLGLPPDLPIELDDSLIRQFQLIAREAVAIENSIVGLQARVGDLSDEVGNLRADVGVDTIRQILTDALQLIEPVQHQLDNVQPDLDRMEEAVPARERTMTDKERKDFQVDRERLHEELAVLKQQFEQAEPDLGALRDGLTEETKEATVKGSVNWLRSFKRLVQGSILVQARSRLETVSVETIEMDSREAFGIALANRMDFMNARAALVDNWRVIAVRADALQSNVRVAFSGDVGTSRDNMLSFDARDSAAQAGIQFDAPFTRLLERNGYRQSLIDYQRNRRNFIQSRDSLQLGLRVLLRQIEQLRMNLEIQRRAVAIAIRRVHMTRLQLDAPVPPPQLGRRPAQFGPSASRQLLQSQASLRNTQNRFMSAWLNYYAAKMRLDRELGIMLLDEEGRWTERPLPGSGHDDPLDGDNTDLEELPLPPPTIPTKWIELVRFLPQDPNKPPPVVVESPDDHAASIAHASDTN